MGTILAKDIIADASEILHDVSNVRNTKPQMLRWLNAGLRELVIAKPEASAKNVAVQMVAGTKQTIPPGALLLIDMTRNMGTDGSKPGRVITFIERAKIDRQSPNWHADKPSATIQHYTYDRRDPNTYYVYPPQPATMRGYAELIYGATPDPIATEDDAITVDDIYANSLMTYLLFRAYSKTPAESQKATEMYARFTGVALGKEVVDAKVQPSTATE